MQAACGVRINPNKSGDLGDEHRLPWRNGFERMDKFGKAMTVWGQRGYGASRSFIEHGKEAWEEMERRREYRKRMVRARRAGLYVDREGFIVPRRLVAPRVVQDMDAGPPGMDAWKRNFIQQREMTRWAENLAAGDSGTGAEDSHDAMLPSFEEIEGHGSDDSGDSKSDADGHLELDELRLSRGLPPRQYRARRLPPFDPTDNLRLQNPAPSALDAEITAMLFPGYNEPMTNGRLQSPQPHDPQPAGTFCPSWDPRNFEHFAKMREGRKVPRTVATMPTPEPGEDRWDSEDKWENGERDKESREDWLSKDGGDSEDERELGEWNEEPWED